jgi:hypothetical protein
MCWYASLLHPDIIDVFLYLAYANPFVHLLQLLGDDFLVPDSGDVVVEEIRRRVDEGRRENLAQPTEGSYVGTARSSIILCPVDSSPPSLSSSRIASAIRSLIKISRRTFLETEDLAARADHSL